MRKITLMMLCILLWSGISVYSATTSLYLVANDGTTWTSTPTGFTNVFKVNLSTCNGGSAATLTQFLTDRTLATPTYAVTVVTGSGNPALASGDQIWVAAGTYNVSSVYTYTANLNIYGGFAGNETATTGRAKGSNTWNFTNETTINGTGSTTGIFTATADRVGAIFDGLSITACGTTQAIYARAATVRYCKFTSNTYTALTLATTTAGNTALCSYCYFNANSNSGTASNAASINASAVGTCNITNCTFDTNSATATTGGSSAGVKTAGAGNTTITNCIFKNNTASAGGSSAVSFYTATGSMSNCLIYGNTGKVAIYMNGGTVYNCTVVNNTSGGAYLASSANICKIYNTVFWGTDSNSGNISSTTSNSTSIIQNSAYTSINTNFTGTPTSCVVLPQTNVGIGAPYFTDPTNNNWQLAAGSSLVDTGNGSISGSPANDLLNVTRPKGNAYDIGTYEYVLTIPTISWIQDLTGIKSTDSPVTLIANLGTGVNGGSITYTSGNTGVVTVSGTTLTVVGLGSTTVTAHQAANTWFNAATDVSQNVIVSKATPTITITGTTSFTYNGLPQGPNTANTGGSIGAVSYSYVSADGTTYPASATKPTNAGSYTVTATVAADANYNQASSSATAFTIAQAPLTINGISIANKVYDGNNTVCITGTAAYSGLVNNENPAIAGTATAAFADATVGNGKSVSVSGYAAPSTNYSITQPTGFTANIYPVTSTFSKSGSSNWTTATLSEWTYAPMAATDLVISSGELVIDQTPTVHSITVNPGAKLTLASGQNLASAGTITLQSDETGTGTFVDNGSATVTATVKQYLTSGRNWYFSSPVTGATGSVVLGTAEVPTGNSLWEYNEANANWNDVMTPTSPLTVSRGFVANNLNNGVITFTGTLNTGSLAPVTINRSNIPSMAGFNLVGNPYPSYLDWDQVSAASSYLSTTIWQRTKTVDNSVYKFDTYNTSGKMYISNSGRTVNSHIPPMQAFWVRVEGSTSGTLNLTNAMRSHKGTQNTGTAEQPNIVNDPIFKSKSNLTVSQSVLRLQVSNGTNTDEAVVYSNPDALNSYDTYDSPKMFNNSASIAEIYTVAGSEQLAINGLNTIPYDTEIPLGFTTAAAGTFSLKASQFSNFTNGTRVILKDYANLYDPVAADLSDGSSYNFTSGATSNNTSRFTLTFKAPSIATEVSSDTNNDTWISINNGQIMINGFTNGVTTVEVFNTIGQKQAVKHISGTVSSMDGTYAAGMYVITITNGGHKTTKRFIVD